MKNKKGKVEINNRTAITADLNGFCVYSKEHDFIEVTEWTNGDGFDILISSHNDKSFSLTRGQFDAIKTLVKKLNKL